ncbi:MAG: aminotransferase class IV [Flavobacteriales bacterium]|nr:aminotransferase class IV [Flavobacteriales bacterium]MCB9174343.1 aminotransferase class IV [Flavobacteriales bacterium]
MPNETYINYNGKLYVETEKIFTVNNRAFKYGDAIFETIRVVNGKLMFLDDHFIRLKKGVDFLKLKPYGINFDEIIKNTKQLIIKNNITEGGRIRITLFRDSEGFYTPINEKSAYIIEAKKIETNLYSLNENGKSIDLYSEERRSTSKLSNIKTTNNIIQILAGLYAVEKKIDDCIVLNKYNRIVETTNSNLFLYKKNNIYTPSLDEGCMDGIMRKQILKIAAQHKINIFEGMLNANVLLQTDEVFITNVVKGVQWVKSYKEKTYTNEAALMFVNELNKLVAG